MKTTTLAVFRPLALAALLLAPIGAARAQGVAGTGVITETGFSSGIYNYTLTLTDTGGETVGSLWYAWIPGHEFLPTAPTAQSGSAGWGASPFGNSIQFTAGSSSDDLNPGDSVSLFFSSHDSPAALDGNSGSTPVGASYLYSDAGFSGDSTIINVQATTSVPEPSTYVLIGLGATGFLFLRRRLAIA